MHQLTLLVFLSTVVMLFAALTAAYLIRRTGSDWKAIPIPMLCWVNTIVLLASSVTIELARRTGGRSFLLLTLLLGTVFVLGQVMAWSQLSAAGFYLPTNPHG